MNSDDYDSDVEREVLRTGQTEAYRNSGKPMSVMAQVGSFGDTVLQWTPRHAKDLVLRQRIVQDATRSRVGERSRMKQFEIDDGSSDEMEWDEDMKKPTEASKRAMWAYKQHLRRRKYAKQFQKLCSMAVSSGDPSRARQALEALAKLDSADDADMNRRSFRDHLNAIRDGADEFGDDDDDSIHGGGECLCSSFENPFFSVAAAQANLALLSLDHSDGLFLEMNGDDQRNKTKHDAGKQPSVSSPASLQYSMAHRELQQRIHKRHCTFGMMMMVIDIWCLGLILADGGDESVGIFFVFLVLLPLATLLGIRAMKRHDNDAKMLVKDLYILAASSRSPFTDVPSA